MFTPPYLWLWQVITIIIPIIASPLVLLLLHLFFREVFILLEYCPSLPSRHYLCHSVFIIIIILIIIMIRVLAICLSVSLLGLVTVGSGHHLPVKKKTKYMAHLHNVEKV